MHGGIAFFSTTMLDELTAFYTDTVRCVVWLDQGGCRIFRFGNQLFGFCQRDAADLQGLLTFVYDTNEDVDAMYRRLASTARARPRDNPDYRIYHFYAEDPEGRAIEFQRFLDPVPSPL